MTQIETLMRQMEAKINSLQESIAAKDTEIAELKAEWGKTRNYLVERVDKAEVANAKLKAEIKRLREGVKGAVDSMEFRGVTKGFKTEWHPSFEHGILKPLLSPAPITEGPKEDENALLPCPFCEGKAILNEGPMSYNVVCEKTYCATLQTWRTDKKSTIEAWNRRA